MGPRCAEGLGGETCEQEGVYSPPLVLAHSGEQSRCDECNPSRPRNNNSREWLERLCHEHGRVVSDVEPLGLGVEINVEHGGQGKRSQAEQDPPTI